MNPFDELAIPPAEKRLLQRLLAATIAFEETAPGLENKADDLKAVIKDNAEALERIEAELGALRGARIAAIQAYHAYHADDAGRIEQESGEECSGISTAPGTVVPEGVGMPISSPMDEMPSESVIGSASEVSDEQVAEAQRQDAREAEEDDVNPRSLETVAG